MPFSKKGACKLHTARSAIFVLIRVKPLLFSAPPRLRASVVDFASDPRASALIRSKFF